MIHRRRHRAEVAVTIRHQVGRVVAAAMIRRRRRRVEVAATTHHPVAQVEVAASPAHGLGCPAGLAAGRAPYAMGGGRLP